MDHPAGLDLVTTSLLHGLLRDQPPATAEPDALVRAHLAELRSPAAGFLGPLVLPDRALNACARAVGDQALPGGVDGQAGGPAGLDVLVVTTGGAGSLSALAGREVPGLRVVAARAALRDLDDLTGNLQRVVAAAAVLADVEVEVTLPDAPGWVRTVEAVEAAGLWAHVAAPAAAWREPAAALRLTERLSVLVEADLAFSVSPEPGDEPGPAGRAVAVLAMLVEALVDGAEPAEAAELLLADPVRVRTGLARWDVATVGRVRRRLRAVSCAPRAVVDDLVALGLLPERAPAG